MKNRSIALSAVTLAVIGSSLAGVTTTAWADGTTPVPTSTASPVPVPPPADPQTSSSTPTPRPRGCTGVTPRKPWRLVATRPDVNGSAVNLAWSVVGCTTGYRVNITGTGVDRHIDVAGGSTATAVVPDLPPTASYRISVTSVGAAGDGGVSGEFDLHRSTTSTRSNLTIDFPDAGPTTPVAPSSTGTGPWVNPELTWTAPAGSAPQSYHVQVTRSGSTIVDKTVSGSTGSTRLGDEIAAAVPYTVTLTPVLADGSDGPTSHLVFGARKAPQPEQVTGNAPVVQFSPVTDQQEGRVLGYEIAFGARQTSKHVFVSAPSSTDATTPWVAVDPSFAAVDAADNAIPMSTMVAQVRTITTMGKSDWTSSHSISHTEVATADAAYFAGIGHVGGGRETVPRNGFLKVHGTTADLQVTDLIWSQTRRDQAIPVTLSVYGPDPAAPPALTQTVPATHLTDVAQDAWRASDIPLPDGWTSVVLRRGGTDVARWVNTGGRPCVASVTFTDVATDLPQMWRDSWCAA